MQLLATALIAFFVLSCAGFAEAVVPSMVSYQTQVNGYNWTNDTVIYLTPNGDGISEGMRINVTANMNVNFTIRIYNSSETILTWTSSNAQDIVRPSPCTYWNGTKNSCNGDRLANGNYTINVTLSNKGDSISDATKKITINTTPNIIVSRQTSRLLPGFNFSVNLSYYPGGSQLGLILKEHLPVNFSYVSYNPERDKGNYSYSEWLLYGNPLPDGVVRYTANISASTAPGIYTAPNGWEAIDNAGIIRSTDNTTDFVVYGMLSGFVKDVLGNAISSPTIILYNSNITEIGRATTYNYSLYFTAYGGYILNATFSGFVSAAKNISISSAFPSANFSYNDGLIPTSVSNTYVLNAAYAWSTGSISDWKILEVVNQWAASL